MAHNFKITNAAASAAADAVTALLNGGSLKIYDGTQATDPNTAITTQVLLSTHPLSGTAFGAASNGVATANAVTDDADADATGTASWFRAVNSGGTAVMDGSVGTSGCDLNLNSTAIQIHARVKVTSWTYTQPKS